MLRYVNMLHSAHGNSAAEDFNKSLMYSLHKLYFLIQKHLENNLLKSKGISFSQFIILAGFECGEVKDLTQSLLANHLSITEATLSRHVKILLGEKFITKSFDTKNKRKHYLALTKKGHDTFHKTKDRIDKELEKLLSPLNEKEKIILIKDFNKIIKGLPKRE